MEEVLEIPDVLELITLCWNGAFKELQDSIKQKHHDLDEEIITRLFYGEFAHQVKQASNSNKFEDAFRRDLAHSFPEFQYSHELTDIANGLVAQVNLHPRHVEKMTGGDFGLVVSRPHFKLHNRSKLEKQLYQRGLLCQAKIKKRNNKWGTLTKNQCKILPDRLSYTALLLYTYSDIARSDLNPFVFQLCDKHSLDEVLGWLTKGGFPDQLSPSEIMSKLGTAKIGTDDSAVLSNIIHSKNIPCIQFELLWKDSKHDPPQSVYLTLPHLHDSQRVVQLQYV